MLNPFWFYVALFNARSDAIASLSTSFDGGAHWRIHDDRGQGWHKGRPR
jgi:hypothetical protein